MAGDIKVAVVSGQISSASAGSADFIKAGFGTPKACIVILSDDPVDDSSTDTGSHFSIGFSDFTNNFCIAHQDEDGSAKVDCDAIKSNTLCYVALRVAGTVNINGIASTITDGVRLTNQGEASGTPFATVIMFGGADLNVSLVRTPIASSQNGTATIAHSGFTDGNDKLIFFIGSDVSGEDSPNSGINNSFGVCHATGSDAGGWTLVQRCIGWASDHNATEGDTGSIISTDRVLDIITEAMTQDWGLEVTNLDHSPAEWTVTTRDAGSGAGMEVYSLALDLDDRKAKVGSVDGPTSGTSWTPSVALGFTPQYVGLALTPLTSEDTIDSAGLSEELGISSNTGSGEETCHSWYNNDGAPTTDTNNLFRSRVIDFRDVNAGLAVRQDHSHSSFNSGDWTYTINEENEFTAPKWAYWTIEEAAAGELSQLLGLATETDLALALGRSKSLAMTLGAETDSAQGVNPTKSVLLGTALETDSGFVITHTKQRLVGIALETDAALALGRLKELSIALAAETDVAFVVVPVKGRLLGIAAETDLAFAIPPSKARLLGVALETDTALVVRPVRLVPISLATELDTALALGRLKTRLLGIALETDTAQGITTGVAAIVGTSLEADTSLVLGLDKSRLLGIANETDSALVVRPERLVPIALAAETDTALALSFAKAVSLGLAAETDLALVVVPVGGVAPPAAEGWLIPTYRRRRR